LCGDGLQLQVAHASLYRSSTVKPSGTPPYYREPEIGSTGLGSGVALQARYSDGARIVGHPDKPVPCNTRLGASLA
jgi:hypothetical protein